MENQEEQKIHLYSEGKSYKLYQGNMLDMLDVIEPNSIDIKNLYGFIYITVNSVNDKMYIGKKIFDSNWRLYLGSGIALKRAIKNYGKDKFNRYIIDLAKTKDELNQKEIFYIDKCDAINSPLFYNMAKGGIGGNTFCGKSDDEMKELKKKLGHKGKNHPMFGKHLTDDSKKKIIEHSPQSKKVRCIESNVVYSSVRDAARQNGLHHENISACCRHKIKQCGGLHWEYV